MQKKQLYDLYWGNWMNKKQVIITKNGKSEKSLQFEGEDIVVILDAEYIHEEVVLQDGYNIYIDGQLGVKQIHNRLFK